MKKTIYIFGNPDFSWLFNFTGTFKNAFYQNLWT